MECLCSPVGLIKALCDDDVLAPLAQRVARILSTVIDCGASSINSRDAIEVVRRLNLTLQRGLELPCCITVSAADEMDVRAYT